MDVTAIIMAAGEGTRMKSNHAKVSHKILGKPMICWVADAALSAGVNRVIVVVGSHADEVRDLLSATYDGEDAAVKGQHYLYPHDWPDHWVRQEYLPESLLGVTYYHFGQNKTEQAAETYWRRIKTRGDRAP